MGVGFLMELQKKLEKLKLNFQRIVLLKEIYDELKEEYFSKSNDEEKDFELERIQIKMVSAKQDILKLTMKNKEMLQNLANLR